MWTEIIKRGRNWWRRCKRSIDGRKFVKKMEWCNIWRRKCCRRTTETVIIKRSRRRMINKSRWWWWRVKVSQKQVEECKSLGRCKIFMTPRMWSNRRGNNIASIVPSNFMFEIITMKRRRIITRKDKRSKGSIVKFIFNNIKTN